MNRIARAYVAACLAELDALKPGNVHRHAGGHGMSVRDFEISAQVSAPPLTRSAARVGNRVLDAILATRAAVNQNTNLGIVLLCAPLAAAAERDGALSANVAAVLDALDLEDSRAVFAAIAAANPGGLGAAERFDVHEAPAVPLRDAMAAAASFDLVARQYVNGFADVIGLGRAAWDRARAAGASRAEATQSAYLAFLTTYPDSHIWRKHGPATAEAVRREAATRAPALARLDPAARGEALTAWDRDLKARGLNPGTSADLTVASVFVAYLDEPGHEWLAASAQQ